MQGRRLSAICALTLVTSCGSPQTSPGEPRGTAPPGGTTSTAATFATSTGRVAAAAMAYDTIATDDGPPMSLTDTDGSGLALTKLDARAVVEGPLAYTELHLYFHNPEARIREGRFAITLPPGAALSRFAMENDGAWQEAEVVERMAARRAYEDFLHRKQDPALLEQAAGNEFTARVFPIPANGDKHLVIAYSQELASADGGYVLPLRGLPAIDSIHAVAHVARADRATLAWDDTTLDETAWKPDRDFTVPVAAPVTAIASGDWLAARVEVPDTGVAAEAPASLAILVDTSASRALGYARQVDQVGALIAAIAQRYGGAVELAVAAFDQDVLPIYQGRADGWTDASAKALLARQPLGASDLMAAIDWAAGAKMKRVVVIGDGVVTAGADGDAVIAAIKGLGELGVERLDTVLVGGIRDVDAARTWVSAGLAHDGAVIDLGAGADDAARRLGLAVRSDLAITVKGAAWSWPDQATGVQPGDPLIVYARGAKSGKATVAIGGTAIDVAGMRTKDALLARAAAGAEIARLERDLARATDDKAKSKLKNQIVARSVGSRVLSSQTALLVLETDADYERFGIRRTALTDILVVGKTGLELEHRKAPPVVIAAPDVATTDGHRHRHADGKTKTKYKLQRKPMHGGNGGGADGDVAGAVADKNGEIDTLTGGVDATYDVEPGPVDNDVVERTLTVAPPPPPPPPVADPEPAASEHVEEFRGSSSGGDAQLEGRAAGAIAADSSSGGRNDNDVEDDQEKNAPPALDGPLAAIMKQIAAHHLDDALVDALAWHKREPGDVLGLIGLGEALEAHGDRALAARAYGSLIDLYPGRADLRRFAGERLERLDEVGRDLAIDTYRRAVDDRPDHLTGHRLYAMALVRAGRYADAFAAITRGLTQQYPDNRFRGGLRILKEDLGLVAAAWIAAEPGKRTDIIAKLAGAGGELPTAASTRFVLYWETDANDVDFHIRDSQHGHAWYSHKQLASGGELYEDVTTGYGPECFTIEGTPSAGPYKLKIHYYSRGPMGYGMGVLEIVRHDGKGHLTFEHRPYIAMNDHAYVDLGSVK